MIFISTSIFLLLYLHIVESVLNFAKSGLKLVLKMSLMDFQKGVGTLAQYENPENTCYENLFILTCDKALPIFQILVKEKANKIYRL